eukprot:TRINITY_DN10900_c0_g1_i1.p1 TRINITY_DN10900_c0_g1~~TRINITY_DN10900_c0_g1_i1.p1  ORF type:complete len:349 (+),score=74.83 TRINITY_DN10900_c0_g1_i1:114-1160(+)
MSAKVAAANQDQFDVNPAQMRDFKNADSQQVQAQMAKTEPGYHPDHDFHSVAASHADSVHPADLRACANSPKISRKQRHTSHNQQCDVGSELAANPQAMKAFMNASSQDERDACVARQGRLASENKAARVFPSSASADDDDVHPQRHRERANSPKTVTESVDASAASEPRRFSCNPSQYRDFKNADSQQDQAQMAKTEPGYHPDHDFHSEAASHAESVHPADLRACANSPKISRKQRHTSHNQQCDVGSELAANPQAMKAFMNASSQDERDACVARQGRLASENKAARVFPSSASADDDDVHPQRHRERANSPKTVAEDVEKDDVAMVPPVDPSVSEQAVSVSMIESF